MLWQEWWLWLAAGVVLGVLEMVIPGFILLGFAVGAVLVGILLWAGMLGGSLAWLLLTFALASLVGWWGLRAAFGAQGGEKKIWHRDINEN